MAIIDERVVKMTFDNSDFQEPAEESLSTLDKLKESLSQFPDEWSPGLSNVAEKLQGIGNITFNGLLDGLDLVSDGISKLTAPIEEVGERIENNIEAALTKAYNQIKTGGWNRANNIENAKFMLDGLGLSQEDFLEAADYAVSGTAYTLDAAMKTAAQFGAAGYTDKEDLKKMLRGISGLAAMTNRDFSDYSYLMTNMAGLGRVTGRTLTLLSMRGINAKNVLADALHKTSEEITDMVSKGQIDFKTFAFAMDDAFGEHAKEANKTFNGASANIRAALSKIGAIFSEPYIQNIIPWLNGVRIAINAIKDGIANTDIKEKFGNLIKNFSSLGELTLQQFQTGLDGSKAINVIASRIGDLFDKAGSAMAWFKKQLDFNNVVSTITYNLINPFNTVQAIVGKVASVLKHVFSLNGDGIAADINKFKNLIVNMFQSLVYSEDQLAGMASVFSNILSMFFALKDTVFETLNIKNDTLSKVAKQILDVVYKIVMKLNPTEKTINRLKTGIKGILGFFLLMKDASLELANFVGPILMELIGHVIDMATFFWDLMGKGMTKLTDLIRNSTTLQNIWLDLKSNATIIWDTFKQLNDEFVSTFFSVDEGQNGGALDKVSSFLDKAKEIMGTNFQGLDFDGLSFQPIIDFIAQINDSGIFDFDVKKDSSLFDSIGLLIQKIIDIGDKANDFPQDYSTRLKNFMDSVTEAINTVINNAASFYLSMDDGQRADFVTMFTSVIDLFKTIIGLIGLLVLAVSGLIAGGGIAVVIGTGIKILGDTIKSLFDAFSILNAKELTRLTVAMKAPAKVAGQAISVLCSVIEIIKHLAYALAALALVILVIGIVDEKKLMNGVHMIAALTITIGLVVAGLVILEAVLTSKSSGFAHRTAGHINQSQIFSIGKRNRRSLDFGGADFATNKGPYAAIGSTILMCAIGIAFVVGAMALLSLTMDGENMGKYWGMVGGIAALAILIGGLIAGITLLLDNFGKGVDNAVMLVALGASFVLICTGISMIAGAIALLVTLTNEKNSVSLLSAGLLVGILTAVVGGIMILVAMLAGSNYGPMIASAFGMLLIFTGLSMALVAFAGTVAIMSKLDQDKLKESAKILAIFGGIIVGIYALIIIIGGILNATGIGEIALIAVGALIVYMLAVAITLITAAAAMTIAANAMEKIVDCWTRIIDKFMQLFSYIKRISPEEMEQFKINFLALARTAGEAIPEFVTGVLVGYNANWDTITGALKLLFGKVFQFIGEELIPLALTWLSPIDLGALFDVLFPEDEETGTRTTIIDFIGKIIGSLVGALIAKVPDLMDGIKRLTKILKTDIYAYLEELGASEAPSLVDLFALWLENFTTELENNEDRIGASINRIIGVIRDLIRDAIYGVEFTNAMDGIGESIANGIIGGVNKARSGLSMVGNAIKDATVGSTRKALKINSPSKVFSQIGNYIVEGLGKGVTDKTNSLTDLFNNFIGKSTSGLTDAVSNSLSSLGLSDAISMIITPELDLSKVTNGLGDLSSLMDNANISGIITSQSSISNLPGISELMSSINGNYSELIGSVYSIDKDRLNSQQPVNVNVSLQGDANKLFKVVKSENERFTLRTGYSGI